MKIFDLKSENLVVDYLSFNFQKLEDSKQTELANYLFDIGSRVWKISKTNQRACFCEF